MKVVLSEQARTDLTDIARFIARDNKARARSFVRELQAKARDIGAMPHAFPLMPRYEAQGIRRRTFGNYVILYCVENDRVLIVHILHGARDCDALLALED